MWRFGAIKQKARPVWLGFRMSGEGAVGRLAIRFYGPMTVWPSALAGCSRQVLVKSPAVVMSSAAPDGEISGKFLPLPRL